jgi:uroporphyrinogen-III decarboxylase
MQKELDVQDFDTGFPVDFGKLRQELGPGARILGGPNAEFLRTATPEQVREEAKKILSSGILEGGLFILREGNNLAPGTPLANTEALYHAGRDFGFHRA